MAFMVFFGTTYDLFKRYILNERESKMKKLQREHEEEERMFAQKATTRRESVVQQTLPRIATEQITKTITTENEIKVTVDNETNEIVDQNEEQTIEMVQEATTNIETQIPIQIINTKIVKLDAKADDASNLASKNQKRITGNNSKFK